MIRQMLKHDGASLISALTMNDYIGNIHAACKSYVLMHRSAVMQSFLYINLISPTHRFFENKFCISIRSGMPVTNIKRRILSWGLGVLSFHMENCTKTATAYDRNHLW